MAVLVANLFVAGRHWFNLTGLVVVVWFGRAFLQSHSVADGVVPFAVMTVIALLFGVHMVMAIGGADMPVVVSMLNSYSGWAAAATGFMLSNDLLIVTGPWLGPAARSCPYIMCRAMNRNFISVIAGGFGTGAGAPAAASASAANLRVKWSQSLLRKRLNFCARPRTSSLSLATAWRYRLSTRFSRSQKRCVKKASMFALAYIRLPGACLGT